MYDLATVVPTIAVVVAAFLQHLQSKAITRKVDALALDAAFLRGRQTERDRQEDRRATVLERPYRGAAIPDSYGRPRSM